MAQKKNKSDLVEGIYQNTNLPRKEILAVVEGLFEEIKDTLCSGSSIELRNFGIFELRVRKARHNCRNLRTGELVDMDSQYDIVFKPGKDLKEKLWKVKV